MSAFPELYTTRLKLRKLNIEDLPSLVKYANNKNVSKYILNIPYPYNEYDAVFRISYIHQGFKTNTRYIFSITLKGENELIGEISLHLDNSKKWAQLAYWIGEPFWNQGFITEAIKPVLKFGFEKLNMDLIFATCDEDNIGSIKVLENNNFNRTSSSQGILQFIISKADYILSN
jgi:RimJ/RimL family protein N-acetyltransferase